MDGLKILSEVAKQSGLRVIMDVKDLEEALLYLDVVQMGARNMQKFSLLRVAGQIDKPVLLKRGLSATIEEFVNVVESITMYGNPSVTLCERGICTYEKATAIR